MSIEGLNLSFSNKCPARCVFCPPERGTKDPNFMEPALVVKLMKEISSVDFPWKVKTIQVGENGDAFMSPYFLENLRIIRTGLPGAHINLTTNLLCIKSSHAEAILKEDLLNGLQLNIDGHNAETYESQKHISYKKVMFEFQRFMELRKELNPTFSVGVNVLPLSVYCERVKAQFGKPPLQAPNKVPVSSYKQVRDCLLEKEWFTPDVYIRESPTFFWAERGMDIDFDLSEYQCPQLPRIETEAFISPSGWWYPCCFDSNQDQAYGNVEQSSLLDIHNSEERLNFIQMLKDQEFKKIGFPCSRVPFCKAVK